MNDKLKGISYLEMPYKIAGGVNEFSRCGIKSAEILG